MDVKAKFRCTTVKEIEGGTEIVDFQAANGPNGSENNSWSQYTPSGSLSMTITAKGAVGVFRPGKHYFLIFTEE